MPTSDVCQGYRTHQPPKQRCHLQLQVLIRCEARLSSHPFTIWAIFGCPIRALGQQRMRCTSPSRLACMAIFFTNDIILTLESEVELQQQLDMLQQFCVECGLMVNVKKTKVMVFNFVDPCQECVFEGDDIERVQTFKYLGIMFETTSNLDNVVEHLAITNQCSLFALNRRCARLCIMDVKLRCDLFNTLVCSIASYACKVWVDSKKIGAIEVVYQRFLNSLFEA